MTILQENPEKGLVQYFSSPDIEELNQTQRAILKIRSFISVVQITPFSHQLRPKSETTVIFVTWIPSASPISSFSVFFCCLLFFNSITSSITAIIVLTIPNVRNKWYKFSFPLSLFLTRPDFVEIIRVQSRGLASSEQTKVCVDV